MKISNGTGKRAVRNTKFEGTRRRSAVRKARRTMSGDAQELTIETCCCVGTGRNACATERQRQRQKSRPREIRAGRKLRAGCRRYKGT